jgi:hypothetical protein
MLMLATEVFWSLRKIFITAKIKIRELLDKMKKKKERKRRQQEREAVANGETNIES